MSLREQIEIAEKNARMRDFESGVNLATVNEQEKRANSIGYGLYKIKDSNRCPFAQDIIDNLDVLNRMNYLTTAEYAFVQMIKPLVAISTNEIVNRKKKESITIAGIAKYLNKDRSGVSRTVNKLIEKGILLEIVDPEDLMLFNRTVTERPILMNPEIVYNGDKNNINKTLIKLITTNDVLEGNKIYLPWKVWFNKGDRSGRLYARKSYLKFKGSDKDGKTN